MPDYCYYINRLRQLPPGIAPKKAMMLVLRVTRNKLEKEAAKLSPALISDNELLRNLYGFASMEDALRAIRGERPAFFIQPSARKQLVIQIQHEFPHIVADIKKEGEKVYHHMFDLLGSGQVDLDKFADQHGGREACGYLPWHHDFKTGYSWEQNNFYKEVEIPYGKADILVPWELSCFHHVAVIGQAYWLTGDEKYAQEFVRQVDDWIDSNLPKFGVNWSCTMEVAIRIANWILGFYFFKDCKAFSDDFLVKFMKSLLTHGRHIMANLENWGVPNNHYLSDLVGLIYLGIAFPEFKEAYKWREFGLQELIKEMEKQVYEDGMNFEASTCYHRFALELFFYPVLLCRLNSIDLPQDFVNKLKKMFDFVLYVLKPNGSMPQIGDNGNVRLHVFGKRDVLSMSYLLSFATLYYDDPGYKIEECGFAPEALWVFGPDSFDRWSKIQGRSVEELESKAFPDGGIYVMRHKKDYMAIYCGPKGHEFVPGHAHCDKLGFELCIDGKDIIVDPGTGCYTSNPRLRHHFRSAAAHSAPYLANDDDNISLNKNCRNVFIKLDDSNIKVEKWEVRVDQVILLVKKAEKNRKNADHFVVYGLFSFIPKYRFYSAMFRFTSQLDRPINLGLILYPGLLCQQNTKGEIEISVPGNYSGVLISPIKDGNLPNIEITSALYSGQYGSFSDTTAIRYSWRLSELYCGITILAAEYGDNQILVEREFAFDKAVERWKGLLEKVIDDGRKQRR